MHNISFICVNVAFCVEAFYKVSVFAERVKTLLSDPCHYVHIEYDVNRVGYFNTYFGKRRTYDAHRIGDDVHRSALH